MNLYEAAALYGDFSLALLEIAEELAEDFVTTVVHDDFIDHVTLSSGLTVVDSKI